MPWGTLLREAIRNLVNKPATVNYPLIQTKVPSGFRGILSFDINKCIGCGTCERVCPTNVIKMIPNEKTRLKKAPRFELSKCVFCGSCVDVCPTKAITFTENYHTAVIRKNELDIIPE